MTIVTAMVSPRARPRARMGAPKRPDRAVGRTTCQVISHHVAPRATAFSRRPRGTARMTSRATAVRVGRVTTARINGAVKRLRGEADDSHPMDPNRSAMGDSRWSYVHGP